MRIAYTVRNMIALRILLLEIPTVAVLCASCPKISIHQTVISLRAFMSYHVGLLPDYK